MNLQEKCQGPELRPTFCESLSSRNAHGHLTRAILCENLHEKCRAPEHPELRPTVCASLRIRNAHGHLARANLFDNLPKKNSRDQIEHPDVTQALTPTVRTPQCRHTVWRIKEEHIMIIRY